MDSSGIYFPFQRPPRTGGDYVTLEHVAELHRQGFNTRVLYLADDGGEARFDVPVSRRRDHVFRDRDIYVLGDLPYAVFSPLRVLNCVRLLLNNTLLRLEGFANASALNTYPFSAIIMPSEFAARRLRELGATHEMKVVHPYVPSTFRPAHKILQIAYVSVHREAEARSLQAALAEAHPQFAGVPWIPIANMSRAECADVLAKSALYAALPEPDTLALTTLEALASECRVVGYSGFGGTDFAGGLGGSWITEGDHVSFCRKLGEACLDFVREKQNAAAGQTPTTRLAEGGRDALAKQFHHAVGALYTGFMGADPGRFLR